MSTMNEDLAKEWELFSREEKTWKGRNYFYERWVHRASRSGCVIFSTIGEKDRVLYIVEGYGVGTIDPRDFSECAGFAPVQRSKHEDEEEARAALGILMSENLRLWKRHASK